MNVMGKKMCVWCRNITKLAASVFAVSIAFASSSCLLLICLCYIVVFKSGWGIIHLLSFLYLSGKVHLRCKELFEILNGLWLWQYDVFNPKHQI